MNRVKAIIDLRSIDKNDFQNDRSKHGLYGGKIVISRWTDEKRAGND